MAASEGGGNAPARLRVMSYNMRHAEGVDGVVDVARIAGVIRAAAPDLVALQEVDEKAARTSGIDMPSELARLTGMEVYFAPTIDLQGGRYGNAVLSRLPLAQRESTRLRTLGDGEPRAFITARVKVHGREMLWVATHLDHREDDAERMESAAVFASLVAAAGKMPVLLCGDFNAVPGSRTHAAMGRFARDVWTLVGAGEGFTIPAEAPDQRIDYFWINDGLQPLRMEVIDSQASDHRPIVADFVLP